MISDPRTERRYTETFSFCSTLFYALSNGPPVTIIAHLYVPKGFLE
jgi:hypothetical protein